MKRILLILSLLFFSFFTAFSQDSIPIHSFDIHIMPLTLIDHYTPRLRIGVEYMYKNIGFDTEIGRGYGNFPSCKLKQYIWDESYRFFELRNEIKYYLSEKVLMPYISGELFFIKLKSTLENRKYYSYVTYNYYRYDKAEFLKTEIGFHIKFGCKFYEFHDRMSVDLYGGIGDAKRQTRFENIINKRIIEPERFDEWDFSSYRYEENSWIYHFTLGIKIGINLSKFLKFKTR